jgi:tetratricopeptide (TPR) repeat protein
MLLLTRITFVLFVALFIFPYPCRSQTATSQDCNPNKLARAREFFDNNDHAQAESLFRQLESCPSEISGAAKQYLAQIADSRNCSPIRAKALVAHNRGNHDDACLFVAEIEKTCPGWSELAKLKRLIGECRKSPVPDDIFRQALDLHAKCEWNNAMSLLHQIKEKNPGFSGLDNEISSVQKDIDETKSADDLRSRGRLEEAHTILRSVKSRAGASCPPVDSELESLRMDIDDKKRADVACASGNSKNALSIWEAVRERNPSYDWLDREIESIKKGTKCGSAPSTAVNTFADYMAKGQTALQSKDYAMAALWLKKAIDLRPGDANAKSLIAEANRLAQSQREAMRSALQVYYSGDFERAGKLLRSVVNSGEASPQSRTLARFYLGAALLSAYYLSGENKRNLESEALDCFRQVQAETPKFSPPTTGISKRILVQFNASRQGKH